MSPFETERLLRNMIRMGRIKELDGALASVDLGDEFVTDKFPWLSLRGRWIPPQPGESVVLLALFGDTSNCLILAGVFSEDFPAPEGTADNQLVEFPDGSVVEYKDGALSVQAAGDLIVEAKGDLTITVNGAATIEAQSVEVSASGTAKVDAPSVEIGPGAAEVKIAGGVLGVARMGDQVQAGPFAGVITMASLVVKSA